ncbi:MAG: hypothetical protein JF617_21395, partial [Burkholderiales bacterium]|nr:hypothetical protein [Burkholderiales bacterium]
MRIALVSAVLASGTLAFAGTKDAAPAKGTRQNHHCKLADGSMDMSKTKKACLADNGPAAPAAACRSGRGRAGGFQTELHGRQLRVEPAARHQFVMPADVDDAAGVQHDDAVGLLDGGQPVRDDQRRAVLHGRLQRGLHDAFAFRVQRAGRFVEQQQRRIL